MPGENAVRPPDLDTSPNSPAIAYYPRLSAVAEYVSAHLTDRITLADASGVAGLARKYFSVYFRSKMGISFSHWVRRLRVMRAKELMEAHEASIPRVAFASGFRDVRTFERAFKELVGVPPATYRAGVRPVTRIETQESRLVSRN
jgi:transcriptional regulator GlxA family with amidase domain